MTPPHIVAVVLNWCGEEVTAACLKSLERSDHPSLDVLLVDNGSTDGSGERLRERFPEVHYLQTGENLGYTGGNNRGIGWALEHGADHVLVLNNDTVVEDGAVDRLAATAAEHPDAGAVSPTIVYHDEPDRIWYGGGAFSRLRGLGVHWREGMDPRVNGRPAPEEVTFLTGCAMLLSAAALRDVGGFDEQFFMYIEDAELSVRLRRAGWRLLHEPRARIRHRQPVDPDPAPFGIAMRDRNRRLLMRRHFGPLGRVPFWSWYLPTRFARMLQYLARGDAERVRAVWQGMTGDGELVAARREGSAPAGRGGEEAPND